MQYWPGLIDGFLAKTRLDLAFSVTSTIESLFRCTTVPFGKNLI